MKAVLIVVLALSSVLAIDITSNVWTKGQQQSLAQIQKSNWGSFILNFSELHLQSKGAFTELLTAIDELLVDLDNELNKVHQNFARRTDQHNRDVTQLTLEIETAQRDVFNADDLIDNVLFPQRDRFQNILRQLKSNIADNRRALAEETQNRNKEHAAFESRLAEHQEALDAVDECLQLLSTLSNPSLAQIKTFQASIQKIQKKTQNHSRFSPFIKALIAIASEQNFSNQEGLKQIVGALNDLRNNLVDSINQETSDEAEAQKNFEDRVAQLNSEHADFQRQVLFKNAELTRTEEKITQSQEYLRVRKGDLATLQAQLQAENDNYAAETDIYNNLVAQYQHELSSANAAKDLLTQPSFEAYVKQTLGF